MIYEDYKAKKIEIQQLKEEIAKEGLKYERLENIKTAIELLEMTAMPDSIIIVGLPYDNGSLKLNVSVTRWDKIQKILLEEYREKLDALKYIV